MKTSQAIAAVLLAALSRPAVQDPVVTVEATVETAPVRHSGDAADDPAIWVHPSDPSKSLILGDDKGGGLCVYGLDGRELQVLDDVKHLNNVDLRYGFPLAGSFADGTAHERVDLVGVGNQTDRTLRFYKIHAAAGRLEPAGEIAGLGLVPYGSCMFRSAKSGKYSYFVNDRAGLTQQWELHDGGSGRVAGSKTREFKLGSIVEGCVADDALGFFYIAEENVAIWKYGAEPGDGDARVRVDTAGKGGHLKADIEGLALYDAGGGRGYLLASSQGSSTFVIYERGGTNKYVGSFRIGDGAVDGVSGTDGIEVTSAALGPAFSKGLFVAQDDVNTRPAANQNYKLVPWEAIASKFIPPLLIEPAVDPRK
ncbi:MAG: phytase [Planctomycetes bacterium]|nr:phytase [Planctomycetota bacterium]